MSEVRIRVEGEERFDEREWLRREVLWAALIVPYNLQYDGWFSGTTIQQHNSNFSRAALYSENKIDVNSQEMAFFNQGKNIGGILSRAALFRTTMFERPRHDDEELTERALKSQTLSVDIAVGKHKIPSIEIGGDDLMAYRECQRLAVLAGDLRPEAHFARTQRLLRAAKVMTGLAIREIGTWQEMARQNPKEPLPILRIPNGGTPRSAGPRVERLQPVFHEIVSSEIYRSL